MLKSKIKGAKVTETKLYYEGSITLDEDILEAADILPGERLEVLNINNGARVQTYAIKGEKGSGLICMNGPAARKAEVGDRIIILSYVTVSDEEAGSINPKKIKLDENNRVIS